MPPRSRSRKCIKVVVAFLCIQVRIPDNSDWGKLVRVLKYIRGTLRLPLILRAEILSVVKCWFDSSFLAPILQVAHWSDDVHGIRFDNVDIAEAKNK